MLSPVTAKFMLFWLLFCKPNPTKECLIYRTFLLLQPIYHDCPLGFHLSQYYSFVATVTRSFDCNCTFYSLPHWQKIPFWSDEQRQPPKTSHTSLLVPLSRPFDPIALQPWALSAQIKVRRSSNFLDCIDENPQSTVASRHLLPQHRRHAVFRDLQSKPDQDRIRRSRVLARVRLNPLENPG